MNYVTNLIDEGNLCGLVLVVMILAAVGHRMVQSKPSLQIWGLRFSALTFVAFAIMRIIELGVPTTSDLLSALMVGLGAGALLVGPAWIVLAISGFLYEQYWDMTNLARARSQTRRAARDQRLQESKLEPQPEPPPSPEQLQAEREAAELRQQESERATEEAKRREEAIAACELLYHLRAPDLGERFTREQLGEFVKKFMGADKSIDVIERRAGELQRLIQQHYEAVSPPSRFTDLAELTAWHERQRQQIGSLSVADMYKQDFLVQLNERYAELTQQTLEKL